MPDFDSRAALLTDAFSRYQTYLVRYVFGYTRHWQDAENIVQELWKYAAVYFPEDRLTDLSLLRRKAYQLFIDHYRASQRRPIALSDELPERVAEPRYRESASDGEEESLKAEFFGQFSELALSDEQRNVLWLHARYGYTYQEVADMTGRAVSTIGDWVALGRKLIAEQLSERSERNA